MMAIFEKIAFYWTYPFVRYALIVGVLIALCSSLLGVTLVLKRFSFIGDGLSHVAFGGMAVAAVLGEQCPVPMRRVGVKDVFGHSGPAWELLEQFGLRSDAIIAAVKELV